MPNTQAYAAHSATTPLAPYSFDRRDPGPTGRPDPDPLLRRLPFGPPCRPQRVGGDGLPSRPRARDRRPGDQGRRGGLQVQGGRSRGRRLHGGLVPALRELRRGARAVLRERHDRHLWRRREGDRTADARRLLRADRGRREVRAAHLRQARPGGHGSPALRRHHDLVAAAALEGRQGEQGRRGGARRARPHGGQARPCPGRARGAVHHLARQERRTPSASGPTRW